MKLAAIDIGSNSVHMIIAATSAGRAFEVIDRVKEMVFLGRSMAEHGRLTEEAFAAGLEAIGKFHKLALRHGVDEILAVATAAVREAENGGEFLYAVAAQTGITPQVISGVEEARYIYLAVRNVVDLFDRSALIIDIGGGSVEAIVGNCPRAPARQEPPARRPAAAREVRRRSAGQTREEGARKLRPRALGTGDARGTRGRLRHRGRHLGHDPGARRSGERAAGRRAPDATPGTSSSSTACKSFPTSSPPARPPSACKPSASTSRARTRSTSADSCSAPCSSSRAPRKSRSPIRRCARAWCSTISSEPPSTSALSTWSVTSAAPACSSWPSAAGRPAPIPDGWRGSRSSFSTRPATLHGLRDSDRRLLEYAAILHDVGQHVGYERHEHHAAYIIRNGDLRGFDDKEREMIALIARYHRKSRPRRKDPDYDALSPRRRKSVRVLAGILRLADGLDRSHHQLVHSVRCRYNERELGISAIAEDDAELEVWGARRKAKLLERALGRKITLYVEPLGQAAQPRKRREPMPVASTTIELRTKGDAQVVDITDEVRAALEKSGLRDGIGCVFVPGATGAVTTIEYEPGCVADLQRLFDELAPPNRDYEHERRWGDGNGHSHLRAALLGPSLSLPVQRRRAVPRHLAADRVRRLRQPPALAKSHRATGWRVKVRL